MKAAITKCFSGSSWQWCRVHFARISQPSGVESSNCLFASCRRSPARWRSMRSATRSWRAASSVHPRSLASSRRPPSCSPTLRPTSSRPAPSLRLTGARPGPTIPSSA
ncbi:MAG: hypothetical protein M0Z95_18560 [Actinomycetota bacterium]|nr:hypothetical protein [Actinomycetota bacterium]